MTTPLETYLSYYLGLENPGYALLVTGEWGVGKTYQVLNAIPEQKRCYVSLFGLQTIDEVHSSVLAAMDPKLAKVRGFLKDVSETAKDAGGIYALGAAIPGAINAALRREIQLDRLLVFDDLERCGLELKGILGIINTYVEHFQNRVVVIAHDANLIGQFQAMKEKIVGQTIRVEPQVEDAFVKFSSFPDASKTQKFVRSREKIIINIFNDSGAKSLRILRHVIEDLGRLFLCLEEKHLSHADTTNELVALFSAINIEVRAGRLTYDDLNKRSEMRMQYEISRLSNGDDKSEKPNFVVADERYPSLELENNLLQDEVLVQMFIEGRYDADSIRHSLDNSSYFLGTEEAPPWKIVINFDEIDDSTVESATAQMEKQFHDRGVTNSGEMLQIFSLRLLMAERGMLDEDIDSTASECITYIDDLLEQGRLPPRESGPRWYDTFDHAYDGYGYWTTTSTRRQFQTIYRHLIESRERALVDQFPGRIVELLKLVRDDGQQFFDQVCFTATGENPYAQTAILSHISVEDFVDAWLSSPPKNWRIISRALQKRYESLNPSSELWAEIGWARELLGALENKARQAEGFRALRIERVIPEAIRSLPPDEESCD